MTEYCTHEDCHLEAAATLAWMGRKLMRRDLLLEAERLMMDEREVHCQRIRMPRPPHTTSAPMAPLP